MSLTTPYDNIPVNLNGPNMHDYEATVRDFSFTIPEYFNFGFDVVDRRADDNDKLRSPTDNLRRDAQLQAARRQDLAQQLVRPVLEERHLAGRDPVQRGLVGVVDPDAKAGPGEGEAEWKADVAAATENDKVEILDAHRWHSSSAVPSVTASMVLGPYRRI